MNILWDAGLLLLRINLPHLLNIPLLKLPLHPIIRHAPLPHRLSHLLEEAQSPHRTLPVTDILRFDLNQRHTRIFRPAGVHAVFQVAEPGGYGL